MIIAVTGGRDYEDKSVVWEELLPYAIPGNVLIHGGARGADTAAHEVWTQHFELPAITVPAAWDRTGRAAGMARNYVMAVGNSIAPHAVLKPDLLLAFPGGKGTAGMVKYAYEKGIPVVRVVG